MGKPSKEYDIPLWKKANLHQVFQVAVDDGMIRQNPTDNMLKELKLSHGFEREKKEALTVAQEKLFFDYMLSHPKDTR